MSKPRRRVTVDADKSLSDDGQKPSVFERLGTSGVRPRKYAESSSTSERLPTCRYWRLNGSCHFGSNCKFSHPSFTERERKSRSPEEKRTYRKRGDQSRSQSRSRSRSESRSPASRISDKSLRQDKMKSAVVVRKSKQVESDEESEDSGSWNLDKLDYKKELELEKKRQQLQRELSQLAGSEDEPENIKIQKKVKGQSDSDSSPDRSKQKKPSKISPFKMKLDKKSKLKSSPLVTASVLTKPRAVSPAKNVPARSKEQKKKLPESDDEESPRAKLKKARKMAKQIMAEKVAEPESPVKKKKSPRSDKKEGKVRVSRFSDGTVSPVKKHRSKSPAFKSKSPSPIKKQKSHSPKGRDKSKSKKKKADIPPPISFDRKSFSPEHNSRSRSKTKAKGRKGSGGKKVSSSSSSSDSSSSSSSSPEVKRKKRISSKSKEKEKQGEVQKKGRKSRKKSSESPPKPPPHKPHTSPPRSKRQPSPDKRRKDQEVGRKPDKYKSGSPDSKRSTSSSPGRERRVRSPPEEIKRRKEESMKRRPERSPDDRRLGREERRPEPGDESRRPEEPRDRPREGPRDEPRRPDQHDDGRRQEGRHDMRRRDESREDLRRERAREDQRTVGSREELRREPRDLRRNERSEDLRRPDGRDEIRRIERDELRRPERDEFRRGELRGEPRGELRRPEFERSPGRRSLSPVEVRRDRHGRIIPEFRPVGVDRGRFEPFQDRFEPDRRSERELFTGRDRGRLDPPYDREREHLDRYPPERPRVREDLRRTPPYERPGYDPAWDRGRGRGWRGRGRGMEGPPIPAYDAPPPPPGPYARDRYPDREFGRVGIRREWDEWDRRDDRRDLPLERDRRFDDRLMRDDLRPREPWPARDDRRPDFRDDRLPRRDDSFDRRENRDVSPYMRRPEGRDGRLRDPSFDRGGDRVREARDRDDGRSDRPDDRRDMSRDRNRDDTQGREDDRRGPREDREDRGRRDKRDDKDDPRSDKSPDPRCNPDRDDDRMRDRHPPRDEGNEPDGERSSRTKDRLQELRREEGSPRSDRGRGQRGGSRHSDEGRRSRERTRDQSRSKDEERAKDEERSKDGDDMKTETSRKRVIDEGDKKSTGSSPSHKRARDISPAHSYKSHGSGGGRSQSGRSHYRGRREELQEVERRSRSGSYDRRRRDDSRSKGPIDEKKSDKGDNSEKNPTKRQRSVSKEKETNESDSKRRKTSNEDDNTNMDKASVDEPLPDIEGQFSPDHRSDFSPTGDDSQLENSKEVFSDWSDDDDANEILVQEPSVKNLKNEERRRRSVSRSSRGSRGSRTSRQEEKKIDDPDRSRANSSTSQDKKTESITEEEFNKKDLDGIDDESIDYEAISSDEGGFMEEDGENKKKEKQSIVDILDIDWSSLQKESRPKSVPGSALNRFKSHQILKQIGVSKMFSGEALYKKVITHCQKQLEQELEEGNEKNVENTDKSFQFEHEIAAFHTHYLDKKKARANLFNVGPYRRALCLRKDIEIRKELCKTSRDPLVFNVQQDKQVQKTALQAFKQLLYSFDGKLATDMKLGIDEKGDNLKSEENQIPLDSKNSKVDLKTEMEEETKEDIKLESVKVELPNNEQKLSVDSSNIKTELPEQKSMSVSDQANSQTVTTDLSLGHDSQTQEKETSDSKCEIDTSVSEMTDKVKSDITHDTDIIKSSDTQVDSEISGLASESKQTDSASPSIIPNVEQQESAIVE